MKTVPGIWNVEGQIGVVLVRAKSGSRGRREEIPREGNPKFQAPRAALKFQVPSTKSPKTISNLKVQKTNRGAFPVWDFLPLVIGNFLGFGFWNLEFKGTKWHSRFQEQLHRNSVAPAWISLCVFRGPIPDRLAVAPTPRRASGKTCFVASWRDAGTDAEFLARATRRPAAAKPCSSRTTRFATDLHRGDVLGRNQSTSFLIQSRSISSRLCAFA